VDFTRGLMKEKTCQKGLCMFFFLVWFFHFEKKENKNDCLVVDILNTIHFQTNMYTYTSFLDKYV